MKQSDVLIIGAGPTGLVLALWLTRLGVKVRIVDKTAEPGTTSRALAVQARTLELYRQLDLTDAVLKLGHKVPAVNLWVKGKPATRLPFERDKMEEIGLIPSDTGKEGGKRTGDRMSHYIKLGGRFALVVEQLLATGFEFTWREIPPPRASSAGGSGNEEGGGASISGNEKGGRTPLSGKRTKFTCPHQGCQNAWAKPGASLMCAIHEEKMLPTG